MKIETAYKLTDKNGVLLNFDSSIARTEQELYSFVEVMYDNSPSYTDRRHSANKEKHVVELGHLYDIIDYVQELYGNDYLKLFFTYQSDLNELIIDVLNLSHKMINRNVIAPDFIDSNGNIYEIKTNSSLKMSVSYESVIKTINKRSDMKNSEYAVMLCLAKSNLPLARSDVAKRLRYSERSITNAFNELDKKGLITKVNKTGSSRLNKYKVKK